MIIDKYDEVLSIDQLMEYLAIGKTTAYNLLRSGEIKVFRIGRIYKIPKKSVDEYIDTMRNRQ